MTSTKVPMKLEALRPEYLAAKVAVANARKVVKAAEARFEMSGSRNSRHARELTETLRTSSGKLITNAQAFARGSGGGASVVYGTRCKADGHTCTHDPAEAPFSDDELNAAEKQIGVAEKALAKAEKALGVTDPTLDVVAVCAEVGARYCWWPATRFPDPSKQLYRGKPITDAELSALGPIELQRRITVGEIVDTSI